MVDPLVVCLQTVRLVGDVFDVKAEAVEEFAFKQLSGEEETALWMTSSDLYEGEKKAFAGSSDEMKRCF